MEILVVNPGSTSTKVALYQDEKPIWSESIDTDSLVGIDIKDQLDVRYESILEVLDTKKVTTIDVVVARGGALLPMKSGGYLINDVMIDRLLNKPILNHGSNLGAPIARKIARNYNVKSYIYDSISVDEMTDVAKVSGLKGIERASFAHVLNSRAMAMESAKKRGVDYKNTTVIVSHLGGGITTTLHKNGRIEDLVSDDEGTFSPERSGRLPGKELINLCYTKSKDEIKRSIRGEGGIYSYFGSKDVRSLEGRVYSGDREACTIYEALIYNIAKDIGELATVVYGNVDEIVITGGIANSIRVCEGIEERIGFIAPVRVIPGEDEMGALARGCYRVHSGLEEIKEYIEENVPF